jgi:hypothetical protein
MVGLGRGSYSRIVVLALLERPADLSRRLVGASPSGKATDFDSVIRRFDPSRPSHLLSRGERALTTSGMMMPTRRCPPNAEVGSKTKSFSGSRPKSALTAIGPAFMLAANMSHQAGPGKLVKLRLASERVVIGIISLHGPVVAVAAWLAGGNLFLGLSIWLATAVGASWTHRARPGTDATRATVAAARCMMPALGVGGYHLAG